MTSSRNKLIVPQSGTQPASTPLENMLQPTPPPATSDKKRTSFYLDQEIYKTFKIACVKNGTSVSEVVETFMKGYC